MVFFLIDNILVLFGGRVFQQTFGISMGTNFAPLLTDLFLHAYDADILKGLLKYKDRKLAQTFNSSFRYIDDVCHWPILHSVIIYIASIQMSFK